MRGLIEDIDGLICLNTYGVYGANESCKYVQDVDPVRIPIDNAAIPKSRR